ncbi:hypothetical protein FJZ53_05535 [Candidatus Woesearchaeota archaeon]|nr:hypothetical protein [Candidatus Woesearchaeota archaeon]
MENILVLVDKANKSCQIADHFACRVYPILKEPKLVMTIAENLYNAFVYGMDAFLAYEHMYKRIDNPPADFKSRFDVFKSEIAPRYGISKEQLLLISDLKRVIDYRRKSPVEFVRSNKIIICSDDYRMITMNYDKVKDFLEKSKPFFTRMNSIFKQNDRRR